jgi:hypothetical protein
VEAAGAFGTGFLCVLLLYSDFLGSDIALIKERSVCDAAKLKLVLQLHRKDVYCIGCFV